MTEIEANISWAIGQDEIDRRIKHMGKELAVRWPEGKPIDMVVVLDSGLFFANDLIRAIQATKRNVVINLHSVKCEPYPGGHPDAFAVSGLPNSLGHHDAHVLLVDALLNTGKLQSHVAEHVLEAYSPKLIETCVLLLTDRPRSEWPTEICYYGFKVPDVPMVGYGLGAGGMYHTDQGVRSFRQPIEQLPGEPVTDIITMPDDAEMPKGLPPLGPPPHPLSAMMGFCDPELGPTEPAAEPAEPGAEPAEADQEADTPPQDAENLPDPPGRTASSDG